MARFNVGDTVYTGAGQAYKVKSTLSRMFLTVTTLNGEYEYTCRKRLFVTAKEHAARLERGE